MFSKRCGPDRENFTWLVFFDDETPEPFRTRIARYEEKCALFTPVFVERFTAEVFIHIVESRGFLTRDYLITSRVDNDDALSEDYVYRVQTWVKGKNIQKPIFVNFSRGCIVVGKRLYLGYDSRSHFASLVESSENPITVYRNHMEMEKWGQVQQIGWPPAWLEVRHPNRLTDKNVCRSWMPLPMFIGKRWFPTVQEFELFSIHDTLAYPFRLLPWLVFRAARSARARIRRLATPGQKSE